MTHRTRALALAAIAMFAQSGLAQFPEVSLVANLDTSLLPETASGPADFVGLNEATIFSATTIAEGRELWASDGTAAGTRLLRDICFGPSSPCGSEPILLGHTAERALLMALDATFTYRLWVTDGTFAGTRQLTTVELSFQGLQFPAVYDAASGRLYFIALGSTGHELWMSDGTSAGTVRVASLPSARIIGSVHHLVVAGDRVYFLINSSDTVREIWVSDGTSAGTRRLEGLPIFELETAGAIGSILIASARTAEHGVALWSSDGTPAGTHLIWDPVPGAPPPDSFENIEFRTPGRTARGLLVPVSTEDGDEILQSDGTASGTVRVISDLAVFSLGPSSPPFPPNALKVGDRVLFAGATAAGISELWISDGTVAGTRRIATPCVPPGACGEPIRLLASRGDLAFFGASDPAHGYELWVSEGTAAGTRRVTDTCPGPCSSQVYDGWAIGGRLYTAMVGADARKDLWVSDGTTAGTERLTSEGTGPLSSAALAPNGKILLSTGSSASGNELWVSDGTTAGTLELLDLQPSREGPFTRFDARTLRFGDTVLVVARGAEGAGQTLFRLDPGTESLAAIGPPHLGLTLAASLSNRVLFSRFVDSGYELWTSDGTAAGTVAVPGVPDAPICDLVAVGGRAFFLSGANGEAQDLWRTDGTAAGTQLVASDVGPTECIRSRAAALGEEVVFLDSTGGLWRSNGAAAGTRRLTTVPHAGPDFGSGGLTAIAGKIYFFVAGSQRELWVTDGTAAGTKRLKVTTSSPSFGVLPLVGANGLVFFTSFDTTIGTELWVTRGTPETTRLVADLAPGPAGSEIIGLGVAGDRFYFARNDPSSGYELWLSDGSTAGTRLVTDLAPGPASSFPLGALEVGDRLVFTASNGASGAELWMTDGTPAGTRQLTDMAPGRHSSSPLALTVVGDRLYFAADDAEVGSEFFALTLPAAEAPCTAAHDLCLHGGRVRVRVTFRDPRSNELQSATAVPFADRSGFFWFFNPDNIELVVKVLDGASTNAHWWSFYGALSDVEYWVEVTDLASGRSKTYHNPRRNLCGVGDTLSVPKSSAASFVEGEPSNAPITAGGGCTADGETLCLLDGRFAVEVDWRNHRTGETGHGGAIPGTAQTGYFWFFNAANVELVVKLLDGRGVNGKFWVFYGALSDVEYTLRVTDAETGTIRTYTNPPGEICGRADVGAF